MLNVCLMFKDTTEVFIKYPSYCALPRTAWESQLLGVSGHTWDCQCVNSPPFELVTNSCAGTPWEFASLRPQTWSVFSVDYHFAHFQIVPPLFLTSHQSAFYTLDTHF